MPLYDTGYDMARIQGYRGTGVQGYRGTGYDMARIHGRLCRYISGCMS